MTVTAPPPRRHPLLLAVPPVVLVAAVGWSFVIGGLVRAVDALATSPAGMRATIVVQDGYRVHVGLARVGSAVMRVQASVSSSTGDAWVGTSGSVGGRRVDTTLPEATPYALDAPLEGEIGSRTVAVTAVPQAADAHAVVTCTIRVDGRVVVTQTARGRDAAVRCEVRG